MCSCRFSPFVNFNWDTGQSLIKNCILIVPTVHFQGWRFLKRLCKNASVPFQSHFTNQSRRLPSTCVPHKSSLWHMWRSAAVGLWGHILGNDRFTSSPASSHAANNLVYAFSDDNNGDFADVMSARSLLRKIGYPCTAGCMALQARRGTSSSRLCKALLLSQTHILDQSVKCLKSYLARRVSP